ncbi:MAG TPA: hypothetical protein VGI79_00115 [Caulobacteraceae bacterium]|jgi:hypothetical protein
MLKGFRRRVWAAIALLCTATTPALAAPLKWRPPNLVNPVVITVTAGDVHARVSTSQDCILRWPTTKHVGTVWIEGCHNLVSIGGWNSIAQSSNHTNSAVARILYLSATSGVAHIEGLLGDASSGGMSDGIDIEAPLATVQIENVRIDGIYGYNDEFHADCVQPFGGVKALRIYNFTCRTGYQGLSIWPVTGSPRGWTADIERTNVALIGADINGSHNNGGYIYWPCANSACTNGALTSLNEVYLQPRAGTGFSTTVNSPSRSSWSISAGVLAMIFPNLPIVGHVIQGPPPTGDFVPSGVAGVRYVSPGYAS